MLAKKEDLLAVIICSLLSASYSEELNSIQPTQLSGKGSMHTITIKEEIKDHILRENEVSFMSFQKNNSHICGGARLNYKHVLSVEDCSKLISNCTDLISAVSLAAPGTGYRSYSILEFKKVQGVNELILVTLKLSHPATEYISIAPLLEDDLDESIGGVVLGWQKNNQNYSKDYFAFVDDYGYYIVICNITFHSLNNDTGYIGNLLFQNKHLAGIFLELAEAVFIFEPINLNVKDIRDAIDSTANIQDNN